MKTWPSSSSLPSSLLGAGFLLVLSTLSGWPVLFGGGLWYLDNPAHLAEILERARPGWSGWSDLAFCGFPLGQWHSPLAYGALAGLVRLGTPVELAYAAALWTAHLFPPLVLFGCSHARLGAPRATLLASILLLQPPALVGIESAWGGMWTFYLAAGAWLCLMRRWSSDRSSLAGDAAWIGAIGLLHLFVFATIPLLAAMRLLRSFRPRTAAATLISCLLGALAAASFWMPAWLAHASGDWIPQNLSPGRLLWALAVPADLQTLTSAAPIPWKEALQPGLLPILALLALGLAGINASRSGPGTLGGTFALATLAVLLLLPLLPAGPDRVWGPVSWRLLYVVRLGLAWCAVDALAPKRPAPAPATPWNGRWTAAGLLILAIGWWIAAPLRHATRDPQQQTLREVEALWTAIRTNAVPGDTARICLQDTYRNPAAPPGLARNSHLLAFTAAATGARQVGAYYGMAPQPTSAWTSSEFGRLCGVAPDAPGAAALVRDRLRRARCSRLVTVSPAWTERLSSQPGFSKAYQSATFTLFLLDGSDDFAGKVRPHPGVLAATASIAAPGDAFPLALSWHPDWKLDAPPGARLAPDESGLCRVENLPPGDHALRLRYHPPAWPQWISGITWAALALASTAQRFRLKHQSRAGAA